MKTASSPKKKSLYRELTLGLISLVSIAAIVVNLMSYVYLTYQSEQLHQHKATEYVSYLRNALKQPLWNVDNELVGQIASAFSANVEIASLIIRDDQEQQVYRKIKSPENVPIHKIVIAHNRQKIGTVELGLDPSVYQKRNQQLILAGTAMMALVILVLLIATRWLLQNLLKKPITALIEVTSNVTEENYQQSNLSVAYTEFSPILASFADMSKAVSAREESLRHINEQLAAEIEERNHAEWALQKKTAEMAGFFNVSLDLLCIANTDGYFLQLNPAWEGVLGFSAEELLAQKFLDFVHPDDLQNTLAAISVLKSQHEVLNFANRYRCKDGSYRWLEWRSAPSGNLIYAAARDISERIKTEQQLRHYKDHLEEQIQERTIELSLSRDAAEAANKAKSIFLANMSHELRTPLNAILGFSSIMRKDPSLPDSQRENLDIINRSGEHLLTLINDVLEMAKIEAGRMQLENQSFDLGNLVRDIIDMMQIRAAEKNLLLLLAQSSDFPRYVTGDEAKIRQVLVNLVGNAIKFTSQGGVTVRLGVQKNSVSHLIIEVEDTGLGIKPKDLPVIFEPFVQVGEDSSNKGTGLGLTITRQFVELMNGAITVTSTPNKGSLFRVVLPLLPAFIADTPVSQNNESANITGLADNQPQYRILIAEDQKENQLLLGKLMEALNLPVKIAEDGEQAVALFQSWQPDLIWMDRRMPVMDGMEATRFIRQLPNGKEVKIIAVTASAFTEQRAEMLAVGMDDFVRKPYRSNEIYDCLSRQLGLSYSYTDTKVTAQTKSIRLMPEMLAALPLELRQQLYNTLESLDCDQIEAVIEKISAQNSSLSKLLMRLANNYDYSTILKALESAT